MISSDFIFSFSGVFDIEFRSDERYDIYRRSYQGKNLFRWLIGLRGFIESLGTD